MTVLRIISTFSVGGAGVVSGASYSATLAVFEPGKVTIALR